MSNDDIFCWVTADLAILDIMHGIQALKFAQHPDLRKLLLDTGESPLVYDQTGTGLGEGDLLGLLVGKAGRSPRLANYEYCGNS